MSNEQLETLAAEAGLSVDWKDANAKPQHVSPEVLRKVPLVVVFLIERQRTKSRPVLSVCARTASRPPRRR